MKFYDQQLSDVFKALNSSEDGLTSNEAQQVLEKNGPNKLAEAEKVTLVQRFVSQLKDPMIIILLAAAAVSAVTAAYSGESFTDVFIILAVVLLNAIMGVYQESKAEKAIEALSKMTAATSKVIRDGK
ncbi:MAG: ATPase, partial [Oscillospiraceae bacterium]|nr:ATPase [Oscillospiraceae bacterium]